MHTHTLSWVTDIYPTHVHNNYIHTNNIWYTIRWNVIFNRTHLSTDRNASVTAGSLSTPMCTMCSTSSLIVSPEQNHAILTVTDNQVNQVSCQNLNHVIMIANVCIHHYVILWRIMQSNYPTKRQSVQHPNDCVKSTGEKSKNTLIIIIIPNGDWN